MDETVISVVAERLRASIQQHEEVMSDLITSALREVAELRKEIAELTRRMRRLEEMVPPSPGYGYLIQGGPG